MSVLLKRLTFQLACKENLSLDKAEKIKKEYGDFIDPNTGEFIDKSFSSDFFSVLSRSTKLSDSRLKQLFKSLSTAKPVQQAI